MFVGHLALAFAAKRAKPDVSLAWTVTAVSFVDLLWPVLLLLGAERVAVAPGITAFTPLYFLHYPWSHSLVMGVVWGLVYAAFASSRGVRRDALPMLAALVVSHWLLDFVTHRPDLPLWPGGDQLFGLGLWNSIAGTLAVEAALWIGGLALWFSAFRPRGANGWAAIVSFLLVSTAIWISGPFAPPPPTAEAVGLGALLGFSIIPWAWWIDRSAARRD